MRSSRWQRLARTSSPSVIGFSAPVQPCGAVAEAASLLPPVMCSDGESRMIALRRIAAGSLAGIVSAAWLVAAAAQPLTPPAPREVLTPAAKLKPTAKRRSVIKRKLKIPLHHRPALRRRFLNFGRHKQHLAQRGSVAAAPRQSPRARPRGYSLRSAGKSCEHFVSIKHMTPGGSFRDLRRRVALGAEYARSPRQPLPMAPSSGTGAGRNQHKVVQTPQPHHATPIDNRIEGQPACRAPCGFAEHKHNGGTRRPAWRTT